MGRPYRSSKLSPAVLYIFGMDRMREKSELNAKLAKCQVLGRQMADGLTSTNIRELVEEIERQIRERISKEAGGDVNRTE